MDDTAYIEWRNQNSYRKYPFADDMLLVTAAGLKLADDVFVDAMFFPVNPNGNLFVQSISVSQKMTPEVGISVSWSADPDFRTSPLIWSLPQELP
jgi:hypothetical protein